MLRIFDSRQARVEGLDNFIPKRVLVCQLRQIGDVILVTPTVRLLKRLFPDAVVDVLTEKKCSTVLENNPDIGRVWEIDRSLGILDSFKFYAKVGRDGYDMIVDCQQLPRCRWVALFSDAPVKFTYTPNWYNRMYYTHWHGLSGPYVAKCKAGPLLRTYGVELEDPRPRMYLSDEERAWADEYLAGMGIKDGDIFITVDPSHRRITRKYPAEKYGEVVRLALEENPDWKFIVMWGPGEEEDAREVIRTSGDPERCLTTPEMLTLRQMAAVLESASAHLGNCSAPRHMATALNTPTLTVRGATSDAWTCPAPGHGDISLGLDCQPCNKNSCADDGSLRCLKELEPQAVLDALETVMSRIV